ncbi:MAG: TCP-1/cpn60 chaperonin family protein [Candidatus Caldarchaeum sp.]|nr:TCP-1/cpn60 chaperonin family protein [Candidatus Caldarchaeum sp.]
MHRITPADVPSITHMIGSSLLREELEQKIIKSTALQKGILLKDYAKAVEKDSVVFHKESVAKFMYDMVKTAIGPFGHDKMVSKDLGKYPTTRHVFVTNDIYEFLNLLEFKHPIAKMVVDLAKSVDSEVGDGVASTVLLACSLVLNGCELVREGLHPTVVVEGYLKALSITLETLEKNSFIVSSHDEQVLEKIALSAMRNKAADGIEPAVAKSIVRVFQGLRNSPGNYLNIADLKIERAIGSSLEDSLFVEGVILKNEVIHDEMPKKIHDGRVALISKPIVTRDFRKPVGYDDIVFDFEEPTAYRSYSSYREKVLKEAANKIISTGANVVFLSEGIDEIAINVFVKNNVLAVRRIVPEDMERLAKATGGFIVASPSQLNPEHLGNARLVEEKKIGDSEWVFVVGREGGGPRSILITAPYDEYARDAEHLLVNSLKTLASFQREPRVLAGGGIALFHAAAIVREKALTEPSKKALAMQKFADALESVHSSIVENSGHDTINVIAELRRMHARGIHDAGFDVMTGEYVRFIPAGIVDPFLVVKQALVSAVEFATLVLKVDGIYYIPRTRRELIEKKKAEAKRSGKDSGSWVEEKQY